jgi:hypothetical protein
MKKNDTATDTTSQQDLRRRADEAVATSRAVGEQAQAARERYGSESKSAEQGRRLGGALSAWTRAQLLDFECQALEAEDVLPAAKFAASLALDAAEVAEGDELAIACDPARAHRPLAELVADEERARTEYDQAMRRTRTFIDTLCKTSEKVSARRSAAGLPTHILPRPAREASGSPPAWVEALARTLVPPSAPNAGRIARLRSEGVQLRSDIELQRIEHEKLAADEALGDERRRKQDEDEARARRSAHDKQAAERAADWKKREELAAANRVNGPSSMRPGARGGGPE